MSPPETCASWQRQFPTKRTHSEIQCRALVVRLNVVKIRARVDLMTTNYYVTSRVRTSSEQELIHA
eukprot:18964-Pleurochrysis_carterae.AAC.1